MQNLRFCKNLNFIQVRSKRHQSKNHLKVMNCPSIICANCNTFIITLCLGEYFLNINTPVFQISTCRARFLLTYGRFILCSNCRLNIGYRYNNNYLHLLLVKVGGVFGILPYPRFCERFAISEQSLYLCSDIENFIDPNINSRPITPILEDTVIRSYREIQNLFFEVTESEETVSDIIRNNIREQLNVYEEFLSSLEREDLNFDIEDFSL